MGYENFTTYDEVDPNNRWTQTATRNTGVDVRRNETCYVYKDYGVDYFDEFEHLFTINCTNKGDISASIWIYGQSNVINDAASWVTGLGVRVHNFGGTPQFIVWDHETGNDDRYNLTVGVTYYCTFKRVNDTELSLKIYSDSARTDLLATLSIACTDNHYRYLYCGASYNTGHDLKISAWIENLDLQEVVAPIVKRPRMPYGLKPARVVKIGRIGV